MDITRAKEIVSTLAEGVDPTTGEIFPADHVCNNVEVVRAFYALLQQEVPTSKKKTPENSGKNSPRKVQKSYENFFPVT